MGVRSHLTPEGLAVVDVIRQIATSHGVAPAAVALAWLLHQPTVTAPLSSATTDQVTGLLAADGLSLTRDELDQLEAASASYA